MDALKYLAIGLADAARYAMISERVQNISECNARAAGSLALNAEDHFYSVGFDLIQAATKEAARDVAKDLLEAVRSLEVNDIDTLEQRLHERVDGDTWVIYTARAQAYLLASNNCDAIGDVCDPSSDDIFNPSSQAYFALMADVRETSEWDYITELMDTCDVYGLVDENDNLVAASYCDDDGADKFRYWQLLASQQLGGDTWRVAYFQEVPNNLADRVTDHGTDAQWFDDGEKAMAALSDYEQFDQFTSEGE